MEIFFKAKLVQQPISFLTILKFSVTHLQQCRQTEVYSKIKWSSILDHHLKVLYCHIYWTKIFSCHIKEGSGNKWSLEFTLTALNPLDGPSAGSTIILLGSPYSLVNKRWTVSDLISSGNWIHFLAIYCVTCLVVN